MVDQKLAPETGVEFEIPLLDLPLHIMEKYRDTAPDGKLLPMYSNSTMNLNLKRIAKLCDIDCPLVFMPAAIPMRPKSRSDMGFRLKRSARCWDTPGLRRPKSMPK